MRLAKYLAHAGVASRRASEQIIAAGRVRVDGKVVTDPARDVDETVEVTVDGRPVTVAERPRLVYLLNKPAGVVSTARDPQGRRTVVDLVPSSERLYPVGRLDADTTGLLLLTNDGELAHVLAHPSFGVTKTYLALVKGRVQPRTISTLMTGVELEDGPIAADRARLRPERSGGDTSLVEITLHSGRNRIVRRMLDAVGHPVLELVRRQFGPLHLGSLPSGEIRDLTKVELGQLLTLSREGEGRRPE